ncbi:MAG: DUF1848 family protein [Desulfuromonadales bacterium]|nr:DUF1848 family protein [Desulfuromonadales bacterium]
MNIISASRRTDIPHYYSDWFRERRKAGFAEYRTVFGGGKNGRFRVSLKTEDVLGYLFWTKFAGPFHWELEALRNEGIPYIFQYTITGYGKEIQPGIPECSSAIDDFQKVAETLPEADAIQWRYDPILISPDYNCDWHRKNFEVIASSLQGSTNVVNVSFVEPYLKALSKAADWRSIRWRRPDPDRHKTALRKYPDLQTVSADEDILLADLAEIAGQHDIELRVCCNQEYEGRFPKATCCGLEMFMAYGEDMKRRVSSLATRPSRPGCRCLKTVDIGMDTTCSGGCFYCYITTSLDRARLNYDRHDPTSAMLRAF